MTEEKKPSAWKQYVYADKHVAVQALLDAEVITEENAIEYIKEKDASRGDKEKWIKYSIPSNKDGLWKPQNSVYSAFKRLTHNNKGEKHPKERLCEIAQYMNHYLKDLIKNEGLTLSDEFVIKEPTPITRNKKGDTPK